MMNNETIVSSIKQLCKDNNMTVTQLEKEVGMSQGLVSKWKDKVPSLDKIIDIADYFHVTLDEVVGRKVKPDDDFLNVLLQFTSNNNISWNKRTDEDENVKLYLDPYYGDCILLTYQNQNDYTEIVQNVESVMYYTEFDLGYICIYARYKTLKSIAPDCLNLFIQPDDDSELILQEYETNELLTLWLKILSKMNYGAPDEIRAANLKQLFINQAKALKGDFGAEE